MCKASEVCVSYNCYIRGNFSGNIFGCNLLEFQCSLSLTDVKMERKMRDEKSPPPQEIRPLELDIPMMAFPNL